MATQTTPEARDGMEARGLLLERVLHAHGVLLRRDAARSTRCPADADAVFSEACFRFLSHFQGDVENAEHATRWLRIVIKHSAYALLREEKREAPHPDISAGTGLPVPGLHRDPSGPLHLERCERLGQLAALKSDEREALLLFAAGYSYNEIAELRAWTYTKVNRCLTEGRATLRRMEGGEI